MPFTTYHLASGLLVGFLLRKYVYWPSLLVATVVVDVEPVLVLFGVVRGYSLHGYLHTYLASLAFGTAVGYLIYAAKAYVHPFFRSLYLAEGEPTATSSSLGGVIGWALHVTMDSPIYSDMRPILPAQHNPLYVGYSTGLQVLWDAVLVCGLATYFIYLYRNAQQRGDRVGGLRLGALMVLAGLLVAPMGLGEGLYVDSLFYVVVGEFTALVGLALVTRSLLALEYLSRARSRLTLALAVVAVVLFNAFNTPVNPYVSGYSILASWTLVLAVALLLRRSLNRFSFRFWRLRLPLGDLLVAGCTLSIVVIGVPLLLLTLLLLAARARETT